MTDYRPMASNTPVARLRDPFYVVREKVQLAHSSILADYERWRDLLESGAVESDNFASLGKSLKVALPALRIDLADLQRTNAIVEKNRARFKDIDDEELASRSKFCSETDANLKAIEDHLNSPKVTKKIEKARDQQLMEGGKRVQRESAGSPMTRNREEQWQEQINQQDEIAIAMGEAVNRLKEVALEANRELVEQHEAIKGLDSALDHAKHNMDVVMAKLDALLGSSHKGKFCCIAFLVFLCVLLLILIVYT